MAQLDYHLIELMGLHEQKQSQLELKGMETRPNEGRLLGLLNLTGQNYRAVWLRACTLLQKEGEMTLKVIERASASVSTALRVGLPSRTLGMMLLPTVPGRQSIEPRRVQWNLMELLPC